MRLFIALDIDDQIRQRIGRFLEGVSGFSPDARWVPLESLHITLKFIGEKPPEIIPSLQKALDNVSVPPFDLTFSGTGFFPTPKSPRVFWIGIQAPPELQKLAAAIDNTSAQFDIPKEDRAFSPHLTLARKSGGSGSPRKQKDDRPNRVFRRLQEKLATMPAPEFGTMTAREYFLYQSQLSRNGSRYTKLHSFKLS
ncbi:MAG TPA: RNA 2',3'-cyclic phosphodiesterase [Terriglobales bacterium]|nr:RNA 2',3'-cyclic phosphodiesterase [Terriglobales bacterium]